MRAYTLTKEEIGDAIVFYIGTHIEKKSFFPCFIKGTDTELNIPKDVMFFLEDIPRGSRTGDCSNNI